MTSIRPSAEALALLRVKLRERLEPAAPPKKPTTAGGLSDQTEQAEQARSAQRAVALRLLSGRQRFSMSLRQALVSEWGEGIAASPELDRLVEDVVIEMEQDPDLQAAIAALGEEPGA